MAYKKMNNVEMKQTYAGGKGSLIRGAYEVIKSGVNHAGDISKGGRQGIKDAQ